MPETIEILEKTMPINIIDGWEVSIRDCEFQNFISLIEGKKKKVPYPEQKMICKFLTKKRFSLSELMEFPDYAYNKITTKWRSQLKTSVFIDILDYCRNIIQSEGAGKNLLRYQIDSIQFGNWFSVLRSFLPESAVFELTTPHRTEDQELLELWKKVRNMELDTKEIIERESYSLKVDTSLLSAIEKDEAILCLNYDGLYGINNINRFLQESNPKGE